MGLDQEMLKAARDFQVSEMNYRRTCRWQIFAWGGGLLLGGTSVVFALSAKATQVTNQPQPASVLVWFQAVRSQLLVAQKLFLVLAIVVLTVISIWWMSYHQARENKAKELINQLDQVDHLNFYQGLFAEEQTKLMIFPSIAGWTVGALACLAVFAILLVLSTP